MTDTRAPLLIVEHDPSLQRELCLALRGSGYECLVAADRQAALAQFRRGEPPVVLVGLRPLPAAAAHDERGLLLQELLALAPATKIVALADGGDRATAVRAVAMGAHDTLDLPLDPQRLEFAVDRAFRLHELQTEAFRPSEAPAGSPFSPILTRDPELLRLMRATERLADTDVSVMLCGESGTGKELFARALHEQSGRRARSFVAINCAAIPENLLESELFGYERGAFTGAVRQTPGKIELADGGTLFLDEIGDLPPPLQPKLLRFLQHRVIERVGGRQHIPVDVHVVCATHRDLKQLIAEGRFREDIYYRLAEIVLSIPPLRARPGDAVLLAHAIVRRWSRTQRRGWMALAPDAIAAIEAHAWPGNVRELESVIRRAVILAETSVIRATDLGLEPLRAEPEPINLRVVRERAEREAVVRALARSNGNMTRAAEALGVSRPTLYEVMNRCGLRSDLGDKPEPLVCQLAG